MNPTPEALRAVATRFTGILNKYPETHLDMDRRRIYNSPCGTIACHGGYYALAKKTPAAHWLNGVLFVDKMPVDFREGTDLLARDLGFPNEGCLKWWARENPGLWGNRFGSCMFMPHGAWAFLPDDATTSDGVTLRTIRDWWLAVADRVEAVE